MVNVPWRTSLRLRHIDEGVGVLMTEEEKKLLLELFPKADIGYDEGDQLVIYTGRYPDGYCSENEDWSGSWYEQEGEKKNE
jgi:hypothetical protein